MKENLVSLTSPKTYSVHRRLMQYSYIGFRFVRYKCYPWLALAIAPFQLLFTSGLERTYAEIRYLRTLIKIDFVGVYGLLNDLLF